MSSYSNQPAPEPAPAPAEGTPPLLQVKTKRVGVNQTYGQTEEGWDDWLRNEVSSYEDDGSYAEGRKYWKGS